MEKTSIKGVEGPIQIGLDEDQAKIGPIGKIKAHRVEMEGKNQKLEAGRKDKKF